MKSQVLRLYVVENIIHSIAASTCSSLAVYWFMILISASHYCFIISPSICLNSNLSVALSMRKNYSAIGGATTVKHCKITLADDISFLCLLTFNIKMQTTHLH